jgi:two-component system, OmpR family, response regulator
MRALVVEDDVLVRETVCDFLTADGIECEDAGNAAEAMARLRQRADWQPDVLVTDFDLGPGPTGKDLANELLRQLPALGVVHATGSPECLAMHAFDCRERLIVKPFSARDLTSAVHTVTLVTEISLALLASGQIAPGSASAVC